MMKNILVCGLLYTVIQLLIPYWWIILIIPMAYYGIFSESGFKSFLEAGICIGLVWLFYSLFLYQTSAQIIAERISNMISMSNPILLIPAVFIVAFLGSGISGLSGHLIGSNFRTKSE